MSTNQTWNLSAPPGFRGLRDDIPVTMYDRHLPHWRQEGATYFVTFRLADSLPQEKLDELQRIETEWKRTHPPPRSDEDKQRLLRQTNGLTENWLDQGFGSCRLRSRDIASIVVDSLHYFDPTAIIESAVGTSPDPSELLDGQAPFFSTDVHPTSRRERRYELDCYVVMPNHVHAVIKPLITRIHPLENILQSMKAFTGRLINKSLGLHGPVWQEEYFDRIIRDEEHLWRTIQYSGNNPKKAGLNANEFRLWIRPEWVKHGWGFVDAGT
jgi:putative transposase